MGCCGSPPSKRSSKRTNRKIYRCNKCNFDISGEYKRQEDNAKKLLKGHNSVRIHVICPNCKATSIITTNL